MGKKVSEYLFAPGDILGLLTSFRSGSNYAAAEDEMYEKRVPKTAIAKSNITGSRIVQMAIMEKLGQVTFRMLSSKTKNIVYAEFAEGTIGDGSAEVDGKTIISANIKKSILRTMYHEDPKNAFPLYRSLLTSHPDSMSAYNDFLECDFSDAVHKDETLRKALLLCDTFYYECKDDLAVELDEVIGLINKTDIDYASSKPLASSVTSSPEGLSLDEMDEFYVKIKRGDYRLGAFWDEEVEQYIPPLSFLDSFILNEDFKVMLNLISKNLNRNLDRMFELGAVPEAIEKCVNFEMIGKPGTGKSTIVRALCAALGMPCFIVAPTKNTNEDEYQGKNRVKGNEVSFEKTDFLKGFLYGGIICIEEYNLSDPNVLMGALGQAMVAPYILKMDGIHPVYRHPLTVIIGNMNIATNGSRDQNGAFESRLKQSFLIEEPGKDEFIQRLVRLGYDKKACVKVYNGYSSVLDYLTSPDVAADDLAERLSFRQCDGALELMELTDCDVTWKKALKCTLLGKILKYNEATGNQVAEFIDALPD